MLAILVTVIHVVACIFLVIVVLLQTGKGADIGAVFGGSSQTIFGSSGAGNLLTRLTTATAVTFMFTSLFLTWSSTRHTTQSIADTLPADPPPIAAPAEPAANLDSGVEKESGDTVAGDSAPAPAVAPAAEPAPAAGVKVETKVEPAAGNGAAPAGTGSDEAPAAAPAVKPAGEDGAKADPAAAAPVKPAAAADAEQPAAAAAPKAEKKPEAKPATKSAKPAKPAGSQR